MMEYAKAVRADPGNPVAGLGFIFAEYAQKRINAFQDKNRKIYFITINPMENVSWTSFKDIVIGRVLSRVFMKEALACFEQRSKDPEKPKGFHCHIVVEKRMSPKQMHDRLYNTCNSILGTKKALDIREYPYSFRSDKIDYMSGQKWDIEKEELVAATKQWRVANDIKDLYSANSSSSGVTENPGYWGPDDST